MTRLKSKTGIYVSVAILIFAFYWSYNPPPVELDSNRVKVGKVIDGDTFWVTFSNGEREKVRLIGLDAPELRDSQHKQKGYYAAESTEFLKSLIAGKTIKLEYDVGKYDRYRRILAYAYLEDGTFINAALLENGYATILTIPPNVRHADTFLKLERRARKRKTGLWAEDNE
ncbi:thermonuclease family protein [Pararhodonellum marinum]|uniref:thermonuclease family protein n=1 Tax=Pararhodonellum marinum TaxID=2755358 RepID=UPI00188EC9A5|nr:thermonuclease family protein [Pararhodonellum marinum]